MTKKYLKWRTRCFILTFIILFSSFMPTTVVAATNEKPNYSTCVSSYEELSERLESLIKKYRDTFWTTNGLAANSSGSTSKYYYGIQCNGFAKYIFNDLFSSGSIGTYDTNKYYFPSPNGADLIGKNSNINSGDGSTVKALLAKGEIGDFIQVHRRGKTYGHSMILAGKDDTGIYIFDCNSDGKCGVKKYHQTWATFATKNDKMSLYHSKKYPAKTIHVTEIKLSSSTVRRLAGDLWTLSATINPSNATNKTITWKTSNANVATVDSKGNVTTHTPGQATITAIADGKSANCVFNVIEPEKITLSNKQTIPDGIYFIKVPNENYAASVSAGSTSSGANVQLWGIGSLSNRFFQWEFKYIGNGFYDVKSVGSGMSLDVTGGNTESRTNIQQYTPNNTRSQHWQPVQVQTGVYLLVPEVATNRVMYINGEKIANGSNLEIVPTCIGTGTKFELYAPVNGVSLNKTSCELVAGQNTTLAPTFSPAYATRKGVTWSSDNTGIATVDSNGKVTAVKEGKATITVKTADNAKTATCTVTVKPVTLTSVSVKSKPTKTTYVEGNSLATAGLKLTASYNNGSTKEITSGFTCSPTTLNTKGTQTITVNYQGKTATFTVQVNSKTPTGLTITQKPSKLTYFIGESLNTSGLKVTAAFDNGTSADVSSNVTCKSSDSFSTAGTKNVTVSYAFNGKTVTATYQVTVNAPVINSLSISRNPSKTEYTVGESFDASGLVLKASYNNNTTEDISSGFTCSPSVFNAAGTQIVTISYDGKSVVLNVAVKTAKKQLEINTQPAGRTAAVGNTVYIRIDASGDNLTYQWQYRSAGKKTWYNSGLEGNKTDMLKVPVTAGRDGQTYRCIVTDGYGSSLTSSEAVLIVEIPLHIKLQPKNTTGIIGSTVTISVSAEGKGLSYQWQYKGAGKTTWSNSGLEGRLTNTLKVPVTAARNGQSYHCIIKDSSGASVVSNAAVLTVKEDSTALAITKHPSNTSTEQGGTTTMSVTADGKGLIYQWQYQTAGTTEWKKSGIEGSKTSTITITGTMYRNGQKYRCIVTDKNGNTVTSNAGLLTVYAKSGINIVEQPRNVSGAIGETVTISVKAAGTQLTYQWQYCPAGKSDWYKSGLEGAKTTTLKVPVKQSRDGQKYRCVITDISGKTIESQPAVLNVR